MEKSQIVIKPSIRSEQVKEYYFSSKLKEIEEMKKGGADIINLGIGSPDLPPSQATLSALSTSAADVNSHGYQSYYGISSLREAFAIWYKKYFGVILNPDNEILPLMGSKEGIMHISMAFVNPSEHVLIPNPGYPTYSSVTKLVGGEIHYYDLDSDHTGFLK